MKAIKANSRQTDKQPTGVMKTGNGSYIVDPSYLQTVNTIVNASMLQNFLTGIYTVLYLGTMYLLLNTGSTQKNFARKVVVSTISVLYAFYILYWIIQWYLYAHGFVLTESEGSIYVEMAPFSRTTKWLSVLEGFLFYMIFAVSDALLIWRCYHVWGMSLRAIVIPLLLFLLEFGLILTATILSIHPTFSLTVSGFTLFSNIYVSGLAFASAGTTVMTTLLIGYKIHTVTRLNGTHYRYRFKYIKVMIIESAAISSINLLAVSVLILLDNLPKTARNTSSLVQMYLQAGAGGISGMAPTALIARLAVTNGGTNQTSLLSFSPTQIHELRFGSPRVALSEVSSP